MEKVFIIVGHGLYGSGIQSTIELIAGKMKNVFAVDFTPEITPNRLKKELEVHCKKGEDIIIICDIIGGTPFKMAAEIVANKQNVKTLAGVNVNGIMEGVLQSQKLSMDQIINLMIETTRLTAKEFQVNAIVNNQTDAL